MSEVSDQFDVAVVGGGPAGLAAAIALAQAGAKTVLVAPPRPMPTSPHHRAIGRLGRLPASLDVWRRCAEKAAPLQAMRLVDDTRRLIRAPEVQFSAGKSASTRSDTTSKTTTSSQHLKRAPGRSKLRAWRRRHCWSRAMKRELRSSMRAARCARGSLSVRMDRGRSAVPPPASARGGALTRSRPSPLRSQTRAATQPDIQQIRPPKVARSR